jgi:hypothetical protein
MFNKKIPQAISMVLLIGALAGSEAAAQMITRPESKKVEQEITALLKEFLEKVDSAEMHDRFWAEDLIYTSGMGAVKTKADIMKSMRESAAKPAAPDKPAAKDSYGAEEIVVRAFGDTALLNFKLVQHAADGKTNTYRNSGTFMKRNGKWQVVNWQATRIVEAATEKKN